MLINKTRWFHNLTRKGIGIRRVREREGAMNVCVKFPPSLTDRLNENLWVRIFLSLF